MKTMIELSFRRPAGRREERRKFGAIKSSSLGYVHRSKSSYMALSLTGFPVIPIMEATSGFCEDFAEELKPMTCFGKCQVV